LSLILLNLLKDIEMIKVPRERRAKKGGMGAIIGDVNFLKKQTCS